MAVSLSTSPALPLPGRAVFVSGAASVGNAWRLLCTDAPPGSALRKQIDDADASQVEVFAGAEADRWKVTFDVAGVYTFTGLDITVGASTYGGGYQGDPNAAPSETIEATTASLKIYVGQALELELGPAGPDRSRLRLYIWDDTIQETNKTDHGEVTPRIVEPIGLSLKGQSAARAAAVTSAVDALAGVAAATALGNLSTALTNIRTRYETHRVSTTFHNGNDDDQNPLGGSAAASSDGIVAVADATIRALNAHIRTRLSGDVDGTGDWHETGSNNVADLANIPVMTGAGDLASAINCIADAHRVYEAHRVADVHDNPDTTALTALPALLAVHSAYLAALASQSPTPPTTSHSAVVLLTHSAGAKPVT